MFEQAHFTDLPEFKFGHAQDAQAGTGCTAVISPEGAIGGIDVRGGGPATRETDLLKPENMVEAVHAVVLAGGSAFGLEASCGVMEVLAEQRIGLPIDTLHVPIVTSACLFDLSLGQISYPNKAMGRLAALHAFDKEHIFGEGNVGAGTGASVGKILGSTQAMKTGFGMSFLRSGNLIVGSLVALNALGNVMNPNGTWLAGCLDNNNQIFDSLVAFDVVSQHQLMQSNAFDNAGQPITQQRTNTTLGLVVTNAKITKAQATKVSSVTHDAFARVIKPVHTSQDGDAIFTLSSNKIDAVPDYVAVMATEAMEQALYRAVYHAKGAYGLPSVHDI